MRISDWRSDVCSSDLDLFGSVHLSATNIHDVKRQTSEARALAAADIAMGSDQPCVIWVDTDYEADAVLAALKGVRGVLEVRGSHPVDRKENTLAAFVAGSCRVLITKPSLTGYGLNLQHCAITFFTVREDRKNVGE